MNSYPDGEIFICSLLLAHCHQQGLESIYFLWLKIINPWATRYPVCFSNKVFKSVNNSRIPVYRISHMFIGSADLRGPGHFSFLNMKKDNPHNGTFLLLIKIFRKLNKSFFPTDQLRNDNYISVYGHRICRIDRQERSCINRNVFTRDV